MVHHQASDRVELMEEANGIVVSGVESTIEGDGCQGGFDHSHAERGAMVEGEEMLL